MYIHLNFDQFQSFIEKIHSKLKVLHVNFSKRDINFLDADRWQKFLSQNVAELEKFSLHYREPGLGDDYSIYNGELNQFISPFWMEKNLIFDIEIHEYNILSIYFLVLRTRWYKYMNSSIEYSKSTQFTIKSVYSSEPPDVLLKQITRALNFTQIYHLNIEQEISIERLMQVLHLLPDLLTLKITSLSFYRAFSFLNQVFPTTLALEHAKNIKYVYLEKTLKMQDIEINQKHPEYLRLLWIYATTADDRTIKQLNEMIFVFVYEKRFNIEINKQYC